MDNDDFKAYPAWRQALKDLLAQGLEPGSVIERDWLNQAFGIAEPTTIAEADKCRLVFLSMFSLLREELLEKHRLMLRPVPGLGYEVINPQMQTAVAQRDRYHAVRRELRALARELSFVQTDRLTDAQRQANSDALARVGILAGMARDKRLWHSARPGGDAMD